MAEKRNIVQELLDRNCLITPEAHEFLEDVDFEVINIDQLADLLKDEIVITVEKLQEVLSSFENNLAEGMLPHSEVAPPSSLPGKIVEKIPTQESPVEKAKARIKEEPPPSNFKPLGKKIPEKINIIHESTGKTTIKGTVSDFKKYFLSRYRQLRSILLRRGDISHSMAIRDLKNAKLDNGEQIAVIGIITDKRTLKNGGMLIDIEDPTGQLTLTISSKMEELVGKASTLLNDQVVGFFGQIYEDMFLVNDFIFPDIPMISAKKETKEPISVCFTSDLHIGSKEFLEDSFHEFLNFLNGWSDDPYQQTLASQVKYLIINGDLVEGIGVYPKQEDDLLITDIYEQYKYAAKLLSRVPKWIHILIVSGNHDACRLALPQPAISKEYAPDLWTMPNVTMLSNPSTVELHGKIFLLFHGNSFEDVAAMTPGLSINEPNGPMIYTLRFRHLAPTFGRRTSIVPSLKDELVIETVPDVYHTGHIHINSHTKYRGVECINSGTFQSQTDFMLSKNIHPTPGRVPILNLQTNKFIELVFYEGKEK